MATAQKWTKAKEMEGFPKDGDFQLVPDDLPDVKDGEISCEALYLTVDPYMRGFADKFPTGSVMSGQQVAKVLESKHPDYKKGSLVLGMFGWRTHTVVNPSDASALPGVPLVEPLVDLGDLPKSLGLGLVGMPGATAYFGLLRVCEPKAGETVLVNGAAGAVGSAVGQIAKIKGCKVIGFAGSDDKVAWVKELGFDFAFNYKTCDVSESLKQAAPEGIDCYFDNVGGAFTSKVLEMHMRHRGRIAICGTISSYNDQTPVTGRLPFMDMIYPEIKMEGFIVYRWHKEFPAAFKDIKTWIKEGKLKYKETTVDGFENMFKAFQDLFRGGNTGKMIIKV